MLALSLDDAFQPQCHSQLNLKILVSREAATPNNHLVVNQRFQAIVMSADLWIPEMVIGVDFGMTCTGSLDMEDQSCK